jgi:hypothetical protein
MRPLREGREAQHDVKSALAFGGLHQEGEPALVDPPATPLGGPEADGGAGPVDLDESEVRHELPDCVRQRRLP